MGTVGGQRALALFVGDQRWALQGGDVENGELVLRIAVVNGCDVEQRTIRLRIDATGAGEVRVGTPIVEPGWRE